MRIRTVKPEFFKHEELYDAEQETGFPLRVAFAGLWGAADREGRFQWRPRTLKTDILPHDGLDFSRVLDALTTRGFVVRYASRGREYGWIPSFKTHQVINNRERVSELPPPPPDLVTAWEDGTLTRAPRVEDASPTREGNARACTSGREGKGEGKGREREPTTTTTARAKLRKQLTTEGQNALDGLIYANAQPEALVGECLMILAGERQIKPRPTPEGLSLALSDLRTNNTRPTARSLRTYTADAMRQLTEGISTSRETGTAWDKAIAEAKAREKADAR